MKRMNSILAARHCAAMVFLFAAGGALANDGGAAAEGRKLFTQSVPACALCHALKDAGAEGAIGPNLNELRPDAARVAKALRNGIGQMPAYRDKLTDKEIEALARYVAQAAADK